MTFQATRESAVRDSSLLSEGYDFGFGWGGVQDLFSALPTIGSQTLIGSIWESITRDPTPAVISEVPQTWEELEETNPEYFEPILETRPGRVADSYPQDVEIAVTREQLDKEEEMAIDWGAAANTLIDVLQGQSPGGGAVGMAAPAPYFGGGTTPAITQVALAGATAAGCDGMTWAGGAPPKGYKVVRDSCGNGVLRKVRRRRRRRMLTQGDKSDIASIVSMVGKGQLAASLINRSTS